MAADEAYRWTSRLYDAALEPLNGPVRRAARRLCPADTGTVVVDVGCGTGAALAEYAADGCQVRGVDVSAAMIARARERLGDDADLQLMTGSRLPFPDRSADLVLVSLVLHSVDRGVAVGLLGDAARILRPGGRVLVTDFGSGPLRPPRGWLMRAVSVVAELVAGPSHARCCVRYLRGGGLPSLVARAGLTTETVKPIAGGNLVLALLRAGSPGEA